VKNVPDIGGLPSHHSSGRREKKILVLKEGGGNYPNRGSYDEERGEVAIEGTEEGKVMFSMSIVGEGTVGVSQGGALGKKALEEG